MNELKKQLSDLLERLCQELYIEVEYEPPSCYPLEFQSSLEYYQDLQKNPPQIAENSAQSISPPRPIRKKSVQGLYIRKEDLRRIERGQYEYIPKKAVYPSLFACVADLAQEIPLNDLFMVFTWQEFEDFISSALEHYGYNAFRTFRYTFQKKRHEVDVIARDQHTILFIDAKHWAQKTASQGALIKAAELQTQRAKTLVKDPRIAGLLLEHLKIPQSNQFHKYLIYPMVLTTADLTSNLIVNGVPIISLVKFNAFLNHFSSIRPNLHTILLNRVIIQKKLI